MKLVWGLCLLYIFIQSVYFSIDHAVLPSLWARPSTAAGKHNLYSAVGGGWRLSPTEYWVINTSSPGPDWIGTGAQISCVVAVGAGLPTPDPFGLARPCWSRCANAPYETTTLGDMEPRHLHGWWGTTPPCCIWGSPNGWNSPRWSKRSDKDYFCCTCIYICMVLVGAQEKDKIHYAWNRGIKRPIKLK